MHLARRDVIATTLVGIAVIVYLLWAFDTAVPGLGSTRATGIVVLALGFAASATAVVPGFDQVIHGNRVYLAVTVVIGLVALAAGIAMLVAASDAALGVLVGTMCLLWLIATVHHVELAAAATESRTRGKLGPHGGPRAAGAS